MPNENKEIKRKYGWKPSETNTDDEVKIYNVTRAQNAITKVDLRYLCPPVYDQGSLGSCTGNAIAAAYQFDEIKVREKSQFTPSRLFIYLLQCKGSN